MFYHSHVFFIHGCCVAALLCTLQVYASLSPFPVSNSVAVCLVSIIVFARFDRCLNLFSIDYKTLQYTGAVLVSKKAL